VIVMFCEPSVARVQFGKHRVPSTRLNSFYYISVNNQYLVAKHVHVSFIMVIYVFRGQVLPKYSLYLRKGFPKNSAHNPDVAGNGQSNILYYEIMQQLALIFPNAIFVYNMTIAQHLCFILYYQPKFKWKVRN